MRLKHVKRNSIVTGWDFSTSGVKCLAFDLDGKVVERVHLPTDLWKGDPVEDGRCEINLMQLEGQARASVRAMADRLRKLKRLKHWVAGGISATHHTAGRIDKDFIQVRRAICWNDYTLAKYHKLGLKRLGGPRKVEELIGGPWAIRYGLSHLVKDEAVLKPEDWERTFRILSHGALAGGYLTGNFRDTSVSTAASTGMMDLRTCKWQFDMLKALETAEYRELAKEQLPRIIDHYQPLGRLSASLALESRIDSEKAPWIFPTSDDQQAGLVGGGAVDDGQMAIILGTSAVVNSSSASAPRRGNLDVMRLNWGPYLWMRCYANGAGLINHFFGADPPFADLEREARSCPPGSEGFRVRPFVDPEPSLGIAEPDLKWSPRKPSSQGVLFRACLEALAYLIGLGVRAHEQAGQLITRVTVSGGIAKSDLMCEILASVLDRHLELLASDEGPALGAAVTALAAFESNLRRNQGDTTPYLVADAVIQLVRFREPVLPNPKWTEFYGGELQRFAHSVGTS